MAMMKIDTFGYKKVLDPHPYFMRGRCGTAPPLPSRENFQDFVLWG